MKNKLFLVSYMYVILFTSYSCQKNNFEQEMNEFNFIIGTQTIGAQYKFTQETNLVETAKAIRNMGSNILKISLGPQYFDENYDIPYQNNIQSLTDLAKEKSVNQVLRMDFKYYQLWAYEFLQEPTVLPNHKNNKYAEFSSYKEIYDLTTYLLKEFTGTGKIFYLGNWEGDWHLRQDYDRTKDIDPQTIQKMIKWINMRQRAIDDAKKNTPHNNVEVYHYLEVNLSDLAIAGKSCAINSVLPHTNIDYVSFSSYTATNPPATEEEMDSVLTAHLNYIESKIPPKKEIQGKRLFIGEYGWNESEYSREQINERAKWVIKTALKWGCTYILFWEMYNNELNTDGSNRGFWLIDKNNQKTPLYETHYKFYSESREWLHQYIQKKQRMPTEKEFTKAALTFNALK